MAVILTGIPLDTLTELVNGWGTLPRREDGRGAKAHLPASGIAQRLGLPARVSAALTSQALADAADRLHEVFSTPDSETCARSLTRLLSDTGIRPVMEAAADGTLRSAWCVEDTDHALAGAAGIALREYLADHGFARIGICTGAHCADVYIDHSPGGRRRFCSVTCQNRTRVAAFRSRKAAASGRAPDRGDRVRTDREGA
ncbi:CGNR zinc finger domain-containing protein [Streptomyces sp. NPDC048438]|uniref:CGNR zinc finger domain-containing protein n=1 Tax=Streptomyces sp. NPDC048438 TaxID=3365551 RepID=UPI0037167A45